MIYNVVSFRCIASSHSYCMRLNTVPKMSRTICKVLIVLLFYFSRDPSSLNFHTSWLFVFLISPTLFLFLFTLLTLLWMSFSVSMGSSSFTASLIAIFIWRTLSSPQIIHPFLNSITPVVPEHFSLVLPLTPEMNKLKTKIPHQIYMLSLFVRTTILTVPLVLPPYSYFKI